MIFKEKGTSSLNDCKLIVKTIGSSVSFHKVKNRLSSNRILEHSYLEGLKSGIIINVNIADPTIDNSREYLHLGHFLTGLDVSCTTKQVYILDLSFPFNTNLCNGVETTLDHLGAKRESN